MSEWRRPGSPLDGDDVASKDNAVRFFVAARGEWQRQAMGGYWPGFIGTGCDCICIAERRGGWRGSRKGWRRQVDKCARKGTAADTPAARSRRCFCNGKTVGRVMSITTYSPLFTADINHRYHFFFILSCFVFFLYYFFSFCSCFVVAAFVYQFIFVVSFILMTSLRVVRLWGGEMSMSHSKVDGTWMKYVQKSTEKTFIKRSRWQRRYGTIKSP